MVATMVTQPPKPSATQEWALLSYRMPREPSTPRIAVWRKLKDLGVAQVGDGLVALPHTDRTQEHLEWVAAKVLEAGGEAIVWNARPSTRKQSAGLAQQLRTARDDEYNELLNQMSATTRPDQRTIQRWRRQWRRIDRRDYFRDDLRDRVRLAIAEHSGNTTSDAATGATR